MFQALPYPFRRLLVFLPSFCMVLLFLVWAQSALQQLNPDAAADREISSNEIEDWLVQNDLQWPAFYVSVVPRGLPKSEQAIVQRCLTKAFRSGYKIQSLEIGDPELLALFFCDRKDCIESWINKQDKSFERIGISDYVPKIAFHGLKNRFHRSVVKSLQLNFGPSTVDGKASREKIAQALRWTILLNITVICLAFPLGIFYGIYASLYPTAVLFKILRPAVFFVYVLPSFCIALLGIIFLSTPEYGLGLFKHIGFWKPAGTFAQSFALNKIQIIFPAICLLIPMVAYIGQLIEAAAKDEMHKKYIWFAQSHGASDRQIAWQHIFPNLKYPLSAIASNVPLALVSGSLIVEIICNYHGIGRLLWQSIVGQDWNVVYGIVCLSSVLGFVGLYVIDVLDYYWRKKETA